MELSPAGDSTLMKRVDTLPITYPGSKSPTELYQDMLNILSSDSVPVTADKVKSLWTRFLEVTVEPTGWEAVWKNGNDLAIVDVECVDYEEHQALVTTETGPEENVSLLDLYPLTEQENPAILIEITHLALQKLRFFYEHIWLPWDEDDAADNWVSAHLQSRIRMFYDLQRGAVTLTLAARYKQLIKEGRETREKLNKLERFLGTSDSERELSEIEAVQLMQFNLALDQQRNEIKLLLDPTLRVLLYRYRVEKRTSRRNKEIPEAFLVWPGGSLNELQQLIDKVKAVLPPNLQTKVYPSINDALEGTCAGDTVYLAPGRHELQNLGGLEYGGKIEGLGSRPDEVVIFCDSSEVLLPYQGGMPMDVRKVTLLCSDMGILMARGTMNLHNCILVGQKPTQPIGTYEGKGVVSMGGKVEMNDVIFRQLNIAATVRDNGELHMNHSTITSCVIGLEMDQSASCEWKGVNVQNCKEYGICVAMAGNSADGEPCKTGGISLLQSIPDLRFKMENVKMEKQGLKDVVLSFPRSQANSPNSSMSGDSGCVFQPGTLQFDDNETTLVASLPKSLGRMARSNSWSHGLFSDSL